MPTVDEIIARKGSHVHRVDASATVLEATRVMNQQKVGAVVVESGGRIVGIFSERDVLRRVVAEERPADRTRVSEVMTEDVICVRPDADIDEAGGIMQDRRVRHLPVCDADGKLVGMVSIGDVNAHHATHQAETIHYLNEYLYGRV